MTEYKDQRDLEESLKRYWLELKLGKSHSRAPGLRQKAVIPPKEPKEFDWQNSFRQLMGLLQTGRLAPEKEPPKARKEWKWGAKKLEGLGTSRWTSMPPVDFSSARLYSFDSDWVIKPRVTKRPPKRDNKGLFVTHSVRFSQNQISSLCGFDSFMVEQFADPLLIQWLDLSYNRISEIDPVLSMLPNLKTLYLHCNCLSELNEVRNLRFMPHLEILTLFGNPLETAIDYRLKIIAALPRIKRLDWGVVISRECMLAKVYAREMIEKDAREALEIKRAEAAAAEKQDLELKKVERRKQLQLEEDMRNKQVKSGKEIVEKEKEKVEETPKSIAEESMELEVVKGIMELELVPMDEEQSEQMMTTDEPEERIVPLDLADIGPLDVKGKHKRHPDPLPTSICSSVSSTSFCSVETVCLEDIQQEFRRLKELEADVKFKY